MSLDVGCLVVKDASTERYAICVRSSFLIYRMENPSLINAVFHFVRGLYVVERGLFLC